VNTVGTTDEIPILVMPVDQDVRFEVASADVIHSFWVPEFLFKLDVIPGNENGRDNVFEVTVHEEGAYVGRCAELCGTYHAYMNFEVRAVSGEDYDAYLEPAEHGQSNREALESIGQDGRPPRRSVRGARRYYQRGRWRMTCFARSRDRTDAAQGGRP
jgi:cytochrome c oxidase subunit 2